ncbi:hypothetical protein H9657_10785 [Cellulomonas sp. Sa3CUA2]|uniref:Uncharacterized protein n=1 Tax=Cellulomonas avistercoris TaxID=2762242 RepID=A0ABR8QEA1_9CELL|nr:hypothetical protein [Cellulomonas avistercoris]MBD7918756.1 hypothetical protein [Cellulomonas avistercoris]
MTDDLTARLERALHVQEHHEGDLRPDAAALADLHARVARGRRGRTTSYAAVAAVAAGVIGVAGWFGLQDRTAPEPAETPTPTPTVTATPTPGPTPEPSAAASAPPLEPVDLPGLPPMYRAPEGILDSAGKGRFVVAYSSGLYEPPGVDGQRRTLALSAPTGELYHLTDVTTHEVEPVRWSGSGAVRAQVWDSQGTSQVGTVDLRTGEVTVDPRLPDFVYWLGMSGDDELWSTPAAYSGEAGTLYVVPPEGTVREIPYPLHMLPALAPDGRSVVGSTPGGPLVAVDVATGSRTTLLVPAGQRCRVTAWLDATGVLGQCVDPPTGDSLRWNYDEHGGQVVRFDVTGGAYRTLARIGADGVVPGRGAQVRDGVVVTTAEPLLSSSGDCYEVCYGGAYLWSGGQAVPVTVDEEDQVCEVRVGSGGLLLRTGDPCYEGPVGEQWWLVDETTRAARLAAPAVDSDLGLGAKVVVEHP